MEMRHRTTIAWLLTAVCMIMLTAAVLPHHHHHHLLCLQHDQADAPSTHSDADSDDDCHACCIVHFSPLRGHSVSAKPHFAFARILFHLTDLHLLLHGPDETSFRPTLPPYCERLHPKEFCRLRGLRAPPVLS